MKSQSSLCRGLDHTSASCFSGMTPLFTAVGPDKAVDPKPGVARPPDNPFDRLVVIPIIFGKQRQSRTRMPGMQAQQSAVSISITVQ
jgi:hypothetical protein